MAKSEHHADLNPYKQRPPVDIGREKLREMFDEAVTMAYVTGSIGATVSTNLDGYAYSVTIKIVREEDTAATLARLYVQADCECCEPPSSACCKPCPDCQETPCECADVDEGILSGTW